MNSSIIQILKNRRPEDRFALALLVGLVAAMLNAVHVLASGLWQPPLDMHPFRQTQTALSVYWLIQGGPWFAYETPVLGAPWSIPFEFPLYQWIVAIVAMTGLPIDAAGRIVAFAFYIATLWPINIFFRATGLGRIAFLSTGILFLTAPLYLFWSRTVMIKSCALFFSSLALALLASFLRHRRNPAAVGAALAGTAAVLVKATTFPAFAFVGGCLILYDVWTQLRTGRTLGELKHALIAGLVITLPFVVGAGWVAFSDRIKLANDFGTLLTSANLAGWNLGTWQQRFSATLWHDTVAKRVLPDLFGAAVPAAFAAIGGAVFARSRFAFGAILACAGFLVPFLVFSNLHIVHNYYQYANGIFALAAVGISIAGMAEGRRLLQVLAGALLIVLVVAQVAKYKAAFAPSVTNDYSQNRLLKISTIIKEHTPTDSSIVVIGDDWASTVPYLAERKGLALMPWAPAALTDRLLAEPKHFLGDRPLGAIVICRDQLPTYGKRAPAIEQFVAGRPLFGEFGGCQVFAGQK